MNGAVALAGSSRLGWIWKASVGGLPAWCWLAPVGVAGVVYRTPERLELAIAGIAAAALVLLAAHRPDRALIALVVGLPFQTLLLAWLYARGAPAELVRPLGAWKEILAAGIVLAGIRGYLAGPRRLDRVDGLALAFVAFTAAYAALPRLFAIGGPTGLNPRLLAFRASAGFVVLLLAARHARLPDGFLPRLQRVAFATGTVVAAIGVYEFLFPDQWEDFVLRTLQWRAYQLDILDLSPGSLGVIHTTGKVAGYDFVRIGSVLLNHLLVGFLLLVPLAIGAERLVEGRARAGTVLAVATVVAAIMFTQTRSAMAGAVVVAFAAFRPLPNRRSRARVRYGLLVAAGLVIALPGAAATGVADRVTGAASGDASTSQHIESFQNGVETIVDRPLGQGLATSAGVGQRFDVGQAVVTENNYLQVGVEQGVVPMLLFTALTIALIRRLRATARDTADAATAAMTSAALGLAVGAFLLHTWTSLVTAWTFWALAGAALGAAERHHRDAMPRPPAVPVYPGFPTPRADW